MSVSSGSRNSVVHVTGDLDLAARDLVYRACVSAGNGAVEVDLAQVAFIDCAGYGGLVAAGVDLRAHGRSLVVRHRSGQPEHLRAALIRIDPHTTMVWPDVPASDALPA